MLLQGYEYKADKASLALLEAGLPQEFYHLAEEHGAFFQSDKRTQELRQSLHKDDQAREIRLKMMAILAGTAVEVDALLLHFLGATPRRRCSTLWRIASGRRRCTSPSGEKWPACLATPQRRPHSAISR